jgi:hypothetical protein
MRRRLVGRSIKRDNPTQWRKVAMSIAVLFDCSNDTLDQYDRAFEQCPELAWQQDRPFHACVASGDGFLVIDIWESEDAFARFGQVLGPVLAEVNLHPTPDVRAIHRIIERQSAQL